MHRKNIRRLVIKQLKYNHPYWKKMTKKSKKELAKQVVDEVVGNYDPGWPLENPPLVARYFSPTLKTSYAY